VRINDAITLPFVLDSGASELMLPADVVLTLMRAGAIQSTDFLTGSQYQLADGSVRDGARLTLRQVELGDIRVSDVSAMVTPVEGTPLLGQSFLRRLDSWVIDNHRAALIVGQLGAARPGDNGKWFVVLGSFSAIENASRRLDWLRSSGFGSAEIIRTNDYPMIMKSDLFAVVVRFRDEAAARASLRGMKSYVADAFVRYAEAGTPAVAASIRVPADGERVGRAYKITGRIAGLAPTQQAFLVIHSTANEFGSRVYPQGRILPKPDGTWTVRGIYATPGYAYRTYVVMTGDKAAARLLADGSSTANGLATLPASCTVVSPVITVHRE
jgi:clan AA aspartic protease (TIGR02281 family)